MYRWIFLTLSSLAFFLAELFVEQSSPLVSRLCGTAEACRNGSDTSCLDFTATQFNSLFVAHFWAGGLAGLSTGFWVLKYGVWLVSCATAVLLLIGAILFTVGPYLATSYAAFWIMLSGRLIFSCGYFGQVVVSHQVKSHWFYGRELALAFAIYVDCSRAGSLVTMASVGTLAEQYGLQNTLWIIFGVTLLAPVSAVLAGWIYRDYAAASVDSAVYVDSQGHFGFRKLLQLGREFWIIGFMIFFCYSAFLTALSDYPKFLTDVYGYSESSAGQVTGIIPDLAIFTPMFGLLIDRYGGRDILNVIATGMFFLGFLGIAIPFRSYVFAITNAVLMGVSYAILGAGIWGSIPVVVLPSVVGVAMSVGVCFQTLSSGLMLLVGGLLLDQTSHSVPDRWENFFILMASLAGTSFILALVSMYFDSKNPLRPLRVKHTMPAIAAEMNPDAEAERSQTADPDEFSPLIGSQSDKDARLAKRPSITQVFT